MSNPTTTRGEGLRPLKAPFPWFGGKSRVADVIWSRFGDVPNFVDPCCGSLAVLLSRPTEPGTETVNDADCYLANFWRAVQAEPESVAEHADWPVNEADLHARHKWLCGSLATAEFRHRMTTVPDYYDVKIAGWWVWGQCCWIGTGWCAAAQRGHGYPPPEQLPHLGDAGMGIHRKLPHLGDAGRGNQILSYICDLSARLRGVRVACGDWRRVLGPSVTFRHGITGVLLDPPYGDGEMEYAAGGNTSAVAQDTAAWAIENGENPELRIAYCGYEGAVTFPESWECFAWKSRGGYGSQGDGEGRENAHRERIWFSPYCIKPDRELSLFGGRESA